MQYEAIHTCPDYHVIYYNQDEFETECRECHISRYWIDQVTNKVPCKVLFYILIVPHFQRLFRCKNIMQFMDYHAKNRVKIMLLKCMQMVLLLEIWKKSGLTLKKNQIILAFLWQQMVLIHFHRWNPFTWCGLFLLSTITFLHGCQ